MNYEKIYYSIVNKRKDLPPLGYGEIHHIIPRSLGGEDSRDNLVRLTAKEHFICHLLLTKMYQEGTPSYNKMVKAFMMMEKCVSSNQERHYTSRQYSRLKEKFSKIQSISQEGTNNSQYGTRWVTNMETLASYRVAKNALLPANHLEGRNRRIKSCLLCGTKFVPEIKSAQRYCSDKCIKTTISNAVLNNENKFTKKIVDFNGMKFHSIKECAAYHAKTPETIRLWLKSGKVKQVKHELQT